MTLNGVDLASYQTGLNAGEIDGDFTIVKATESTGYTNPSFSGHVKQTLAAGKKLGVYHFISNLTDIEKQADYFLDRVRPYIGKAILALDFEDSPAAGSYIQNQPGVTKAKQWLDYVYQKTGVRPLLYTVSDCENRLDWTAVVKGNYGLWLAQYNRETSVMGFKPRELYGSLKHWPNMVIFQYASVGRLNGWAGNLDLNVFYGNRETWDKYAGTAKATKSNATVTKPVEAKWVAEVKTYTLKTAVKLRTSASTSGDVITTLPAGSAIKTDLAIIKDGYRWVRQPRAEGYGYLATGPIGNTLAYVEANIAHTYYTVKRGDSWWAIASKYGLDMQMLAKRNGKTTDSVIHPGDKLIIK